MQNVATFVIEDNGDLTYLVTEAAIGAFPDAELKRASHVVPENWPLRMCFRVLRAFFGDKGRISEFTRNWNTLWRVDARPIGAYILPDRYENRKDAIDAEVEFLNNWFIERI